MVTKKEFIRRILTIVEVALIEALPESATLDEMHEVVRTIFRDRLYFSSRRGKNV